MGNLNIPLPSLPEDVRPELPTPRLMPVTKIKGEIEARIQQSRDAKVSLKSLFRLVKALQVLKLMLEKKDF